MSEWQPIETAPKDGTRMLLATGSNYIFSGGWEGGDEEDELDGWWDDGGSWWEPHHWMPLPEAPK